MKPFILYIIKLYQIGISPIIATLSGPGGCKFYPTCSEYCYQAIRKRGMVKGVCAGVKRLVRCGPWREGGYDPL